jgi:hypothetical protein
MTDVAKISRVLVGVDSDEAQPADLIVPSMPTDASHAQSSPIAHVLKECVHPLLFVPCSGIVERSSS